MLTLLKIKEKLSIFWYQSRCTKIHCPEPRVEESLSYAYRGAPSEE